MEESTFIKLSKTVSFVPTTPYQPSQFLFAQFGKLEVNPLNFFITSAPSCGLAMIARPDEPPEAIPGFKTMWHQVHVFKHSGQLVSRFEIDRDDDNILVGLQMLKCGHVFVLYKSGKAAVFTQQGVRIKQILFRMRPQTQREVIQFSVNQTCAAVLFNDMSIVFCEDLQRSFYRKQPAKLEEARIDRAKLATPDELRTFAMLPESVTNTEPVAVMTSISQQTNEPFIYICQLQSKEARKYSLVQLQIPSGATLALSPTGAEFVEVRPHCKQPYLLYKTLGLEPRLTVVNVEKTLQSTEAPLLSFSGDPGCDEFLFDFCDDMPCYYNVMMSTVNILNPINRKKPVVEAFSGSVAWLQAEPDGVQIFSEAGLCCLSRVQNAVRAVFDTLAAETTVGSKLMQAYQAYKQAENDSQKITESDKLLKRVKEDNQLLIGIKELLQAARDCASIDVAVLILQAAAHCKLYLKSEEQLEATNEFDSVKRDCRIRNELAKGSPGIFQSGTSFQSYQVADVILRLGAQHLFDVAINIHKFARTDESDLQKLLIRKTICIVLDEKNKPLTDQQLFADIDKEVTSYGATGVYKECAGFLTTELDNSRTELVGKFIEMEPCLNDQIELFNNMKQYIKAMRRSWEACSEELVVHSLWVALNDPDREPRNTIEEILKEGTDQFIRYMKNLISRLVYEATVMHTKYNGFPQTKFQDITLVELLNDPTVLYQFHLQLRVYKQQNPNVTFLQTNNVLAEISASDKLYVEQMQALKGQEGFSVASVLKQFGKDAIKVILQNVKDEKAIIDAANCPRLVEGVKYAGSLKEIQEAQALALIGFGIVDGAEEYTATMPDDQKRQSTKISMNLLEAYCGLKGVKSSIKQVAPLVLTYVGVRLGARATSRSFLNQLGSVCEPVATMKAAAMMSEREMLITSAKSGDVSKEYYHACFKTMEKDVWDALAAFVKSQQK